MAESFARENVFAPRTNNSSPLVQAAMARELDKVKLSALLTASANGDEETVRALLHDEEDGLVQTNVKDAVRERQCEVTALEPAQLCGARPHVGHWEFTR
jgi:prophage DNA circulation protein